MRTYYNYRVVVSLGPVAADDHVLWIKAKTPENAKKQAAKWAKKNSCISPSIAVGRPEQPYDPF